MKIHEYQAKALLAKYGVPTPRGGVAATAAEARRVAEELGCDPMVVKAQIHAGGRGKAGGVRLGRSAAEVERHAAQLLGSVLVTHQTGPGGREVRRVLVEEGLEVRQELYLGIVVDRALAAPVIMASEAGGMEIEEVAAKSPERILREVVDLGLGLRPYQARRLAFGLHWQGEVLNTGVELMRRLYQFFRDQDCSLLEINPLVIATDGRLLALDAKVSVDDNALYRHPDLVTLRDLNEEEPLEIEASKYKLNYIKLEGTVGCMVNGAGLAMATMDIIKQSGAEPANFLDVGGGANAEMVANAFRILLSDGQVRAVLINIFGGILRCDVLAQGVVEAASRLQVKVPVVVRMEGTNVERGREILQQSGLNFIVARGMRDAAEQIGAAVRP